MHERSRSARPADYPHDAADPADGTAPPGDRQIVGLLVAGGVPGMAAVYDRYAARLLDYATGVIGDRHAAGDAVHDALLIAAQRIRQLRDPERLRPWLYAITRREALRALRQRARHTELAAAEHVADNTIDPAAGPRAAELRELVWAAADGLNPADREVIELTVRHGMDGAQLAATLGVSRNQAHAMASRARAQFERALAVVVVARTGRDQCARLTELLTTWDGLLTPLWRKRIARHIDGCGRCGQTRRRNGGSASLLAAMPFLVAPAALRARLVAEISEIDAPAHRAGQSRRAGGLGRDGFPRPSHSHRAPVLTPLAVAILFALLLAAATQPGSHLIDRIGSPLTVLAPLVTRAEPAGQSAPDDPIRVGRANTGTRGPDRFAGPPEAGRAATPLVVAGGHVGSADRDATAAPGGASVLGGGNGTRAGSGTPPGAAATGPTPESGAAAGNGTVPGDGVPSGGAVQHNSAATALDIPPGPTAVNPAQPEAHHDQIYLAGGVGGPTGAGSAAVVALASPAAPGTNRHADSGKFVTHPGAPPTGRR